MKSNIKKLIFSTQKVIKDYSEGVLSHQEAKDEYEKLARNYHELQKEAISESSTGFIRGICYHHNIENFSVFSGLFALTESEFELVSYYGDDKMNSIIIETLQNNQKRIPQSEFSTILPGENSSLNQILYIYPVWRNISKAVFFIALSSSDYFSTEKFCFIGTFFNEIFKASLFNEKPMSVSYFEDIKREIVDILTETINETYSVAAHVFSLKLVDDIFIHMGIFSILEISDKFVEIIRKNFPDSAHIFVLSLNEYLVLTPILRKSSSNPLKKRLEFDYKDISIPYEVIQLKIDSPDAIYQLIQKMSTFKYVHKNRDEKK